VRLLFLDIDGVLNSEASAKLEYNDRRGKVGLSTYLDRSCVRQLDRIIEQTDAKVVVTSCWRLSWPLPALEAHMRMFGFYRRLADKTPRLTGLDGSTVPRGLEVLHYLEKCWRHGGVESFCILDDETDMADLEFALVKTDPEKGLTNNDANRAIQMLGGEPAWMKHADVRVPYGFCPHCGSPGVIQTVGPEKTTCVRGHEYGSKSSLSHRERSRVFGGWRT
jgi:hypothetical protein